MKKQVAKPVVDIELFTDEYWRKRFHDAFTQYKGLTELSNALAQEDPEYAGLTGYRWLENVKRGRYVKLEKLVKVVQLMEQLRPTELDVQSILQRQKLVAPEE